NRAAVLLRNGGCQRVAFARDRFDERGFAAAIWAKDADVLTRGDLQVHFAERGVVSAHHGYVFEREKGWGHNSPSFAMAVDTQKCCKAILNEAMAKQNARTAAEK